MPIILVWIGAGLCTLIMLAVFYVLAGIPANDFNPAAKQYKLTSKMRTQIMRHGGQWEIYELTQWQCMQLGFLSGDPQGYYCYNTIIEKCGDVIRFTQNTIGDSSVNIRYSFLPK